MAWLHELGHQLAPRLHWQKREVSQEIEGATETNSGVRQRILIIEAGQWYCGTLPGLLRQAGYTVLVVSGMEAALERLQQDGVALCLVGGVAECLAYRTLHAASPAPGPGAYPGREHGRGPGHFGSWRR